ncbi:signal peptide peptidase SppA [Larsenimonas rhizosphaerae]|uniref:Signal peptide peptidase SppA n=1 Tax=Larsenimonas rhizosphaerae TaxID=2944682 RepID=A0AA42CXB1_9GAMM|nr:signal peptide peptidase SppA [Larsenimonas rhizosphaerae]MCX2523673.1 signal peptide peptidase SppA [Larsenimonas rhizosphaerae]
MSDHDSSDPWAEGRDERPAPSRSRSAPDDQARLMDRWVQEITREQRRSRRWRIFFRLVYIGLFGLLVFGVYRGVGSLDVDAGARGGGGPHVATVRINGVIDAEGPASADTVIKGLHDAFDDEKARAIVLRINSPGGSPVQSQRIYQEIRRLKGHSPDRPVVAVIEDIGASGAYYIAAAADDIYAAPASLVGSIGVIYSGFGFKEAIGRLGVERRVFTAGENKDLLDPFRDVTQAQRDFWKTILDTTHQQFINDVKAGRGDRLASDPALFSGLVWTGEQAQVNGLTDGVATFDQLIRDRFSVEQAVDYTLSPDPLERLSRQLGQVAAQWLGIGSQSTGSPVRYQVP